MPPRTAHLKDKGLGIHLQASIHCWLRLTSGTSTPWHFQGGFAGAKQTLAAQKGPEGRTQKGILYLCTSGKTLPGECELPQNCPIQLWLISEVGIIYRTPKVSATWSFGVLGKLTEEGLSLKITCA